MTIALYLTDVGNRGIADAHPALLHVIRTPSLGDSRFKDGSHLGLASEQQKLQRIQLTGYRLRRARNLQVRGLCDLIIHWLQLYGINNITTDASPLKAVHESIHETYNSTV
jgi:hypothetical protein